MSLNDLRVRDLPMLCIGSHPGIIQSILDYEFLLGNNNTNIRLIIASNRNQERYFWGENEIIIPVLPELPNLSESQRDEITIIANFQSGRRALESTATALKYLPNVKACNIFAESVPEVHALEIKKIAQRTGVIIAGPSSVGLLLPGYLKLGAIGGTQHTQITEASICNPGSIAVIATSGGMVNELINTVTRSSQGVSFAIALGGDRYPIVSPVEAFLLAEEDKLTQAIVYFGELGGVDEYEICSLVKEGRLTKPVIAYIAGKAAELFDAPPQFGHAKAMANSKIESALEKKKALREVNLEVIDSISELDPLLRGKYKKSASDFKPVQQTRSIGSRHKHLIVSRISGDTNGDIQLLGSNLLDKVNDTDFSELVLSMLLGKTVYAPKTSVFIDYVLRLLVDHGPYVAGAANTIMAARAGKDLVSSLASGMLTIGPRFGGAINTAAEYWLEGTFSGIPPKEFINKFDVPGGIIPGIGHKKYRLDLPDPRVLSLYNHDSVNSQGRHLAFAKSIESITTSKKGNLILNVDGAIAAILLDILEQELGYDYKKLHQLIEIEFFNALFVISRSVGLIAHYLDQRRNDEGLLRLSDKEILYAPDKPYTERVY